MAKVFMIVAAVSGALAVGLGAFGAHGLKNSVSESMLAVWQTGVQYHFYHTFALLLLSLLMLHSPVSHSATVAGACFIAGILCFSGSLYWLALGGPRLLGPVTPLGGLLFIIGWCALGVFAWKMKN